MPPIAYLITQEAAHSLSIITGKEQKELEANSGWIIFRTDLYPGRWFYSPKGRFQRLYPNMEITEL